MIWSGWVLQDQRRNGVVDVGDRLQDPCDLVTARCHCDLCTERICQRVDEPVLHVLVCSIVLCWRQSDVLIVLTGVVVVVGALGRLGLWK